ncbi:MAG: hypothetical protein ACYTGN_12005 [Planctomycetota bacterium]|jgi:hypothetical protein
MLRATTWIFVSALLGLWGYYGAVIDELPTPSLERVAEREPYVEAAKLNNEGVERRYRGGRGHLDALNYFERASDFAPDHPVITANYESQKNRVREKAWEIALGTLSTVGLGVLFLLHVFARGRRWRDRSRLRRLRLGGLRTVDIPSGTKEAELELQFSEAPKGLLRRHPPSVVWTCAEQNKHMKSRRSVKVKGRDCRVRLDSKKVKQLLQYPGKWRCILRLGKTEVGEASARVG